MAGETAVGWPKQLSWAALMAALACSEGTGGLPGPSRTSEREPGGAGAGGAATDAVPNVGRAAQELFDWDHVPRFELTLPEQRWEQLQRDALLEEYVEAELAFEGTRVGRVGLRFKGSWGTLEGCLDEDGGLVCDKLSMKLRFNRYQPERRFYGLQRLNFNSMIYDQSWLHERLAYDLYRATGVQAPRAAWAVITVNGHSYGLFSMVEQVDGRFTDDRWPGNGDGNLYKEAWPAVGDEPYYAERLKTNEGETDHDAVLALGEELRTASDSGAETLSDVLARWMDLEYLGRFLAVEDAVSSQDGVSTFYTVEDRAWTTNHNHYLYQEEDRDFFWLIPWDMDSAFWPQTDQNRVPHWTSLPHDCDQIYQVHDDATFAMAPGCDLVFRALAQRVEAYRDAVDELLAGHFGLEAMRAKVDEHAEFIRDAVHDDPFVEPTEWQSRVAELKANLPILRARVEAFRDGVPLAPLSLAGDRLNDFDALATIDVLLGAAAYSNASTEAQLGVSAEGASGQALRVDFEYQDDSEPWTHYVVMYLPVSSASNDVSGRSGLRFRARADTERPVRVELVSLAHTELHNYVYEGWDLNLTHAWAEYELGFDLAVLPEWATAEDYANQNTLEDVLSALQALRFFPECMGRGNAGYLGAAESDVGYLEIDDLEVYGE